MGTLIVVIDNKIDLLRIREYANHSLCKVSFTGTPFKKIGAKDKCLFSGIDRFPICIRNIKFK